MTASDDVLAKVRRDVEEAQAPATAPGWVLVPRGKLSRPLDAAVSPTSGLSQSAMADARELAGIVKRGGGPS